MSDKLSWIDRNGVEYPLTNDLIVLQGKQGFYMPPITHIEESVPFQAGSRHRETKVEPRDVDVPLLIKAKDPATLRKKVRSCLRMFNPFYNGTIKLLAPDGTNRELMCRYSSGMEGNENQDVKGWYWQKLILVFRAFDPYWYEANTFVETFRTGQPATFFPFFPLRLSSSSVFADTTVDNKGDVEAWPEWIITGPGEGIVLRNFSTGEVTALTHPNAKLGAGESIVINTNPRPPREKSITKSDGTNWFYTLSDESSLWSLQEGINNIRLEMSNATEASSIQLNYRPRYWGP